MPQSLVFDLNQAAINGIRAAGACKQYIFAEGNQWSGAWDWTTYNTDLVNLTDPSNMIIYEMHQYFNDDYSSSDTCQNSTMGQDVLVGATNWLRENGKKGFIGEYEGGPDPVCHDAVQGMLTYMYENSDVWVGATWWAAGPWWGTMTANLEPPSGNAYLNYMPILKQFLAGGTGPSSTSTSMATPTTKISTTGTATCTCTGA
jgi:endoglucanase